MKRSARIGRTARILFGLCGAVGTLDAQATDTVLVPSTVTCTACRITLTRVATLGGPSDPLSPSDFVHSVSRDSRGRYYVAPTANFALIAVYGADGKFIKTLGGAGQGPGEYEFIVDSEMKADSLVVLDQGLQRITVLTPDHAVARTVRVQGTFTGLDLLADGAYVLRGTRGNPATSIHPMFHVGGDGTLIGRFGGDGGGVDRNRTAASERRAATTRAGTQVLVTRFDRYQIEQWRPDGTLLKTFRRSADWYLPWTDYAMGPPDMVKPKAMTRAVWQDSTGLVWTLNQVAVAGWKPARTAVAGREEPFLPVDVRDAYIDTVLEVMDLATGRLVASQRFPQDLQDHVSDGLVYSFRAVDDDIRIEIWRVALTGRP